MSTIKVDTYLTRGGASEIAIDKLKGVSSAGSMTVVGEGGSTTTNLQQGLAKAWCHFHGEGTVAIDHSFNVSSLEDVGTGSYANNFTSNMSYTDYPNSGHGVHDGDTHATCSMANKDDRPPITSRCGIDCFGLDGNQHSKDESMLGQIIHGDLA